MGGFNLFSMSVAVAAITHSIAVNSAPGLSEDIVVIIVQNPFEAPAAHGAAETATEDFYILLFLRNLSGISQEVNYKN